MQKDIGHALFTVIAPVRPGRHEALIKALPRDYSGEVPALDPLMFEEMEMLHYASMFLYEDPTDGWLFVFESNVDGSIDAYLNKFFETAEANPAMGQLLLELYGHCVGVDASDLDSLRRYLASRITLPAAAFVGGVGLTRDRIRADAAIHRVVDQALSSGEPEVPLEQATQKVLSALKSNPDTRNFADSTGDSGHKPRALDWVVNGVQVLVYGLALVALIIWNLRKETTAKEDDFRPHPPLVRAQKAFEDHTPTNHMASIVHLHIDRSRQWAKRAAYMALAGAIRLTSHEGVLGGIETIHFAHWAFANDNRRLIFVSNFDGSWDSYLDDFTLKANEGLTLAWAHGLGFPRSFLMFRGGAANGPKFIDWARQSMVPCPVWYNAYPGVSVQHVMRNRRLRAALAAAEAGEDGASWTNHV